MAGIIYLDSNATTAVDPAVRAAMLPFLGEHFGNPSSPYTLARGSAAALVRAREQVARLIDATPEEIIFTSCGTESNNAALRAMADADPRRRHLVLSRVEHASVLNYGKHLENNGFSVTWLEVDRSGQISLDALRAAVTDETAGVSVMAANNETGILLPIRDAASIAREHGALFHTDAVQAAGKVPVSARGWGVDFLSLSGHKFHAAKGVGVLYIRKGAPFSPCMIGGEQESGRRGGTENVASIAGMGVAAELGAKSLGVMAIQVRALRDHLEQAISHRIPDVFVVGRNAPRLPNTSLLLLGGVESEALLALLDMDGICCSSGSACASGAHEPSQVLAAMGLSGGVARAVLRVSLSRHSPVAEIDSAVAAIAGHVERLRARK
ncbi:MAG: aminotransferase class V-fold PLP-dependent enzyme [bacterium]